MLKKLIAILLIAITAAVFCAEKYAVLIAGNFDDTSVPTDKRWNDGLGDNTEFWNDLYLQWEMLYRKGYAKENITVIFANELDMWQEEDYKHIDRRYRAANATQVELETITNYSATKGNLTTAVEALSLKVGPDDFLYVWAMSHGGSPTQSSLYFNDGEMTDAEFACLFDTVTANKKVFVINANYAGGFLTALQDDNSFVQVSSTDTKSFRADDRTKEGTYIPFLENEEINGHVYYHGEIGFHNYISSYGLTPLGLDNYNGIPLSSAATDGDMLISFLESSNWVTSYESSAETPSTDGSTTLIGHSSSFQYPTILKDAWNQGKPISEFGLRGICAVSDEVILEYDDFFNWTSLTFEENSKTTVFEDKGINVGRASSLTFESNSTITGMGNSYITTGGWTPILRFNDCSFENISVTQSWDLYANGTLQFNSAQLLSGGQIFSEGEIVYFDFTNNSLFEITGGNFKKEIDGELYMSVNYDPELEEESKSLFYLDITIDNSNLLLKNVYITEQPFLLAKEIKNNSTATIENDVVGYVALDLYSNSKFVVAPNARFAEGGIKLYESTEMIIEENGLFAGSITTSDNVSIKLHDNARLKNSLVLTNDCEMELQQNSHFTMEPGYSINFKSGSILRLLGDSEFIVPDNSVAVFEPGSQIIIDGNAKITGNISDSYASVIVSDGSTLAVGENSNISFRYNEGNTLELGLNSELVIGQNALVSFNPNTPAICSEGSKITVQDGGTLYAYETSFSGNGTWMGIIAEVGSTISTFSATISNAEWGINAQAAKVNLIHTYFSECDNGVWLLNCSDYNLYDNYFDGKGTGTGVRVTESTGVIKSNTILNHAAGVVAISCSPLITENYIHDNATCGIALYGYNTYPQLLNPSVSNDVLNNRIINNGLTTTGENGSQIFMVYRANAYLNNGCNNIYSGNENSIPEVPCIKTVSDIGVSQQLKSEVSQIVTIPAEGNYWGVGEIPADNTAYFNLYRELQKGYGIDYTPNAVEPFESDGNQPPLYSGNEPPSQEEQLLKVAMMLEDNGNYKPAIKKYEKLISSYPDTPEYYVATSRLPQVLAKQEESLELLIKTYDDALVSEEISNKDFIKQMKVSTNIKSKKYDDAILLAEELKAAAETDMEKTLCDIEIAICNLMKNSQQKKSSSGNDLTAINKLVEDLIGEEKSGPAFVKNTVIPESTILHQNYPNPFNPVTSIKFALAKAADVKLSVYNISGQKVAELANGTKQAGIHSVDFDGSRFNSGVYYYTLEVNGKAFTQKMILMK